METNTSLRILREPMQSIKPELMIEATLTALDELADRLARPKNRPLPNDLSEEARGLIRQENELRQAIEMKDRKTRGKIYNSVVEIKPRRFAELLRLINRRLISPKGIVGEYLGNFLVQSFVGHGKATALFDLLANAAFGIAEEQHEADKFVFVTLNWLGENLQFSSSVVKAAMSNQNLKEDLCFLLFYCHKRGLPVKTAPAGSHHFPWTDQTKKEERYFAWPLTDLHRAWVDQLLIPIAAQWNKECALLDRVIGIVPDWSILDDLWQKIRKDAIYGLHLDGDTIEFKLEELRLFRITSAVLKKSLPFPAAEVVINTNTFGVEQTIKGRLIDGRLDFAELYWCEYAQWFITLAILVGYYQVLTGEEPEEEPWYTKCGKKRRQEPTERRPAKPHFYSLWGNRKASDLARQACMETFGRDLAPGKTFRAGKNMVMVSRKKVSAVVTCENLSRHAAGIEFSV